MINQLLNNRYRIESELGHGGMGVVYRAHDQLLDRQVAIKVLSSQMIGTEGRARLLREAQAAARMNHPNVVSIYDAGETEGVSFIIMEMLDGMTLADRKNMPLAELIPVLRQVCAALQHAHQQGIVHRDLKPENVFITANGLAKLTDFGLARSFSSRLTADGALVGTVLYMAPEQAMGDQMDGRTDLYALGAMIYEVTAGRLPFHAGDPIAVISQHLYAPVIPPSNYNPNLPETWDDLVLRLMSKRPEDRPASAHEVDAMLEEIEKQLRQGAPVASHSPLERLGQHYLVGRDEELAQAKALWMFSKAGAGDECVLLISGESGVGKTPLVREIMTFAEVTGGKVLQGECYAEGGTPYAPMAQIIRSALDAHGTPPPGGRKDSELPTPLLADLIAIAPDLRLHFPNIPANPTLEPQAEQARLFESFVALCTQLSTNTPLLLVMEDIQWADGGSLFLVRHLARRARAAHLHLLILLTYREAEVDETALLSNVLMDMQRERLAARLKLTRFDREGTRKVVETILDGPVSANLVDAIYRESEGNQFFIDELVKSLVESSQICCQDEGWQCRDPSNLQLPQSARATIQARVAKLPEVAQETLRLAAVIGREFDFTTLQRASDSDEEALIQALELATQARIILEVPGKGETFAFSHGLFPATLRDSLSSLRRHRLHRRVASAIAVLRPDDFATLAYHALAAGDEAGARRYYLKAAEHAATVFASSDVVRYYTQVLELMPPADPQRFQILQQRFQHNGLIGQRNAQLGDVQAMLALAEQVRNKQMRCDALLSQAELFYEIRPLSSLAPAEQAASLAEKLGDRTRQGHALKLMGVALRWRGRQLESRKHFEQAIECYAQAGLPEKQTAALLADCQNNLSLSLGDIGEYELALLASLEAVKLSRQAGDRAQEGTSLRRVAIVHMNRGQYTEGLPNAQAALKLHRELVDRPEEMHDLNVLGILAGWLKRAEESEKYLLACLELAESLNSNLGLSLAVNNYVEFAFMVNGAYETALEFLDERLQRYSSRDDPNLLHSLTKQRIYILGSLGQQAQALQELADKEKQFNVETGIKDRFGDTIYKAQLQAELGESEVAWQTIQEAQGIAQNEDKPAMHTVSLYITRTYIALLQGKTQEALDSARTGIDLVSGKEQHPEFAVLQSLMALAYLNSGQPDQALPLSTRGVQIAEQRPFWTHIVDYIHYRVLVASGKESEAFPYLERAYKHLQKVANQTQDPVLKRGWLENIPINRWIITAYSEQES